MQILCKLYGMIELVNLQLYYSSKYSYNGVCLFLFSASDVSNWTKMEVLLEAEETNSNSRLQLTTSTKGVIWFDQVSAMPLDTYKV